MGGPVVGLVAGALASAGGGCLLVFDLDDLQSGAGGASSSASVGSSTMSASATVTTTAVVSASSSVTASSSSGGPGDAYRDAVLADAPALYLRLDETSGIALFDEVSRSMVGTYSGSGVALAAPGIPGATGTGVTFSGGQALASATSAVDFLGLASYSLEAWINPTVDAMTDDYYGRILAKEEYNGGTNRQGYNILYERSMMYHPMGGLITERWNVNGTGADIAPYQMNEGTFHHVVATFDGATLRLYSDGLLSAQNTSAVPLLDLTVPLSVGSIANGGSPFFGVVDEVAIYDHALTPTAVQTHHSVGATP